MTSLQRRIGMVMLAQRQRRGWTRTRMFIESGVNDRTQRRVENGHSMSWTTIDKMCNAFGIRILIATEEK